MPLRLRRIILWSFIALFLVVAPVLALYSMGYRYHWEKRRLEATGLLMISGAPSDAVVRLDGDVRAYGLPARIGGLPANEYMVRIERPGSHAWEQRVAIIRSRTTILDHLVLFPDARPALVMSARVAQFTVSADARWAAFTTSRGSTAELWVLDLATGTPALLSRIPAAAGIAPFAIQWSPRAATLLVRTAHGSESRIAVVTPAQSLQIELLRSLPPHPSVTWELGSATSLIVAAEGRLHRTNIITDRTVQLVPRVPAGVYAVARGTLYAQNGRTIIATSLDGDPPHAVIALPEGLTVRSFTNIVGTTLTAITDAPVQTLTIATTEGTYTSRTGDRLQRAPDADDHVLWHANAMEVWASSGPPPRERLLGRRMLPIVAAAWHADGQHVFLATAHDITVVAWNASDVPPLTLAEFDQISGIAVHPAGDALTIVGRRGTAEGIWTLPLR